MSRTELLEWVAILVAVVSLWPALLGFRPLWYYAWLLVVMAAMVKILLNRAARIRRAVKPPDDSARGPGG